MDRNVFSFEDSSGAFSGRSGVDAEDMIILVLPGVCYNESLGI
jgi:hypothetical protein